ncbi:MULTISPECIES: hypothetical protein [Streptomyces]|uniref:Uncharacterized protein n=1 Tax=Streptomyces cadmiisoli TaxID=2184053 RepID=A0A2Z4J287_9ACTN|nr:MULTISPECIES: hypothetical protein [Streptomyces]AWW39315.1 hypothetical protein DN051_23855 [Streptomyces cadmiisoli]
MAMNVLGLIGWIVGWWALLYVLIVFLSPGFTFLFVLPLGYCAYRFVAQLGYFFPAIRMRRILRTYPWRIVEQVPHGLTEHPDVPGKKNGWFEFANPARSEQRIPLVFPTHFRTEWWHRRMAPRAGARLKQEIETVWFAGDPRLVGLIAAPARSGSGPRRLHVLEQWMPAGNGRILTDWGVTPDDIERGRRVGVSPAPAP